MKSRKMKGVSPLIAAVLLIVFTLTIAILVANFATSISRENLQNAQDQAACIGAVDIGSLKFEDNKISFRLRNTADITITDFTAAVEFSDADENEVYTLGSVSSLGPGQTVFVNFDVGSKTSSPTNIEVVSETCPSNPASLPF